MTQPPPTGGQSIWPGPAYPQHPGAAYPGGPPPWAPPPKRRRSRWLTVGLPVGLLVLLGSCGTALVLTFNSITGSLGPARDAANRYALALVDQRWDDAQAMLCDDVASDVSADDLAALHGEPAYTGFSLDGIRVHSSGGQTTGEATLAFTTESGARDRMLLPLVHEGDDWRPCP